MIDAFRSVDGSATQGNVTASARAASSADDPALRKASQDFESLFVSQIYSAMRKTVPEGGLLGNSGERMFRDMLDSEMANQAAAAGSLGIGEMLYRQLSKGFPAAKAPEAKALEAETGGSLDAHR